ncbi:MAG: branched-chain amino acid ABC transporter permease [Acidimicrobiales bacterium]
MPLTIRRGSPQHTTLRVVAVAAIAYYALAPIFATTSASDLGQLVDICILALAAMSLNLLIGFTGQISIGHSAFFGLGAYTTAVLFSKYGWSPGWTFPVAAALCFVVGVLVGVPALRLKGLYLALVTLALAQIFPQLASRMDFLTNGAAGISAVQYKPPSWTGLSASRADRVEWLYWIGLVLLVVGYVVCRNIVKSRVGRAMVAVRDNETAAAVMGVNLAVVKTVTFGVSAGLCGLAGSLFVLRQSQAQPDISYFTIIGAIIFLVVMVIGGASSLTGPIVGAIVYYRLNDYTLGIEKKSYLSFSRDFLKDRPGLATIVFAALLIGLMFAAPDGIVGLGKRVGRRLVRIGSAPTLPPADLAPSAIDHPTGAPAG